MANSTITYLANTVMANDLAKNCQMLAPSPTLIYYKHDKPQILTILSQFL
jgi:hypothetical protein